MSPLDKVETCFSNSLDFFVLERLGRELRQFLRQIPLVRIQESWFALSEYQLNAQLLDYFLLQEFDIQSESYEVSGEELQMRAQQK